MTVSALLKSCTARHSGGAQVVRSGEACAMSSVSRSAASRRAVIMNRALQPMRLVPRYRLSPETLSHPFHAVHVIRYSTAYGVLCLTCALMASPPLAVVRMDHVIVGELAVIEQSFRVVSVSARQFAERCCMVRYESVPQRKTIRHMRDQGFEAAFAVGGTFCAARSLARYLALATACSRCAWYANDRARLGGGGNTGR